MSVTAIFAKPFAYQVAAFRLRLAELRGTAKWDDVWQSEHDRAFMVAGAMKADLLADLATAVDKAISQGVTLQDFRRDFRKIVEERGWHGWTGEGTKKGEAWRTRVIYRTNMATSYAAGRYAQLTEGNYAFWIYFHGNSREPRLQHLAWDGLILPPDHEFWASHFPPNGWGCTCRVSGARSMASAVRRGGKADLKLPSSWAMRDPKTGTPVGIGKGWSYAPGASVAATVSSLVPKLEALPPELAIKAIQNWVRSNLFSAWAANPVGNFPLARISQVDADKIGSSETVAVLSAKSFAKQILEHPEISVLEYAEAQKVISQATRTIQDNAQTLIYILEDPESTGHILIVKATRSSGALYITSFRRVSGDPATRAPFLRQYLNREIE